MTWRGSGEAGQAGDPADDATRADRAEAGQDATAAAAPLPVAPPPPPGLTLPAPAPGPYAPPPAPYGAVPGAYGTPPGGYGPAGVPGAPVAWAPPATAYAPTGLEVPGAVGLRFAGVLHRLLAYWLDVILVGILVGIAAGIAGAAAGRGTTSTLIDVVITIGAEFLYFVGLWTSDGRATLGMRLMKLQIGSAADGRTLSIGQAVIRWAALGLPFQALYAVPGAAAVAGLAGLWALVLLVTTAVSPTRQGLHDRFAGSAIVQPVGAQTPATACLLLLILLLVLPFIAIFALLLLGGQLSTILSDVGNSI